MLSCFLADTNYDPNKLYPNPNCLVAGDRICDTEASPFDNCYVYSDCDSLTSNPAPCLDANGDHYDINLEAFNLMSYYNGCAFSGFMQGFTEEQFARMNWMLTNMRQDLVYPCDKPVADFFSDVQGGCVPLVDSFTNDSRGATSWFWDFGDSATDTVENPIHTYNNTGTYTVTLIISNGIQSDTIIKTDYIIVVSDSVYDLPFLEDFEGGVFPPADWLIENPDNNMVFWKAISENDDIYLCPEQDGFVFDKDGNPTTAASIHLSTIGSKDAVVTPLIDPSNIQNAVLLFDVAYRNYYDWLCFLGGICDTLKVYYSSECEKNWIEIYNKGGCDLDQIGGIFNCGQNCKITPKGACDWKTERISLSSLPDTSNVKFKFEFIHADNNNLFIDNIKVVDDIDSCTHFRVSICTSDVNCFGDSSGVAAAIPGGGTPPYTYLWSNGQTDSIAIYLPVGNDTVDVLDANLCSATAITTINLSPQPLTNAGPNKSICLGQNSVIIGTQSIDTTLLYSWSPSSSLNDATIAQPLASPTDSLNEYVLTVSDIMGCSNYDTTLVTFIPQQPPIANAGSDTSICFDEIVSIGIPSMNDTIVYSWLPNIGLNNPNIANPTATPHTTTEYILSVTDTATGCVTQDTVLIKINFVGAWQDTSICFGDSVVLGSKQCIDSNLIYTWHDTTGLVFSQFPNPTVFPNSTSEYVLEVFEAIFIDFFIGFDTILIGLDTVVVVVKPKTVANAGTDTTICFGDSFTIGALPPDTTLIFSWFPATGLNDTTIANPIASPQITTEYILIVTDTCGFSNNDTILVTD